MYQQDLNSEMHQGAIYEYRPFFWLEPPLMIVRNLHWLGGGRAYGDIVEVNQLSDAFRRTQSQGNQEDVMAKAKVRHIIVLSKNKYAQREKERAILVAPSYTLDSSRHPEHFINGLREERYPFLHYLPVHPDFSQARESYIDLREITSVHKDFLLDGKLDFCLRPASVARLLSRYQQLLL
jgi:hypothetical protein